MKVSWNLLWQGREIGTYAKQLPIFGADGNKRAAFIALSMFLSANGLRLTADPLDAGNTFFDAAAGGLDEQALVAWISNHSAAF